MKDSMDDAVTRKNYDKLLNKLINNNFFYQDFSFTKTDDSQDSRWMRGPSFIPLYHFHPLFANLHVRCLSHILNRTAFIYQTATRWYLPPYRITIWLIDYYYYYSRITNSQANLCLFESLLLIKRYWQMLPRFIKFVFKWVDKLGKYDFFWEPISGFDRSEVEKICMESSHAVFGCFPYQLVVVFSTRTVLRSEIFR